MRIYKRFRLPAENAVTGAFVADGRSDGQYAVDASASQPQAEESARDRERRQAELAELRAQYAHLPEAVRSDMGI